MEIQPNEIDSARLSFELTAGDDKPRLDEFIAKRLPRISLTRIRRLIMEGEALLNGERSTKGTRLQPGDRVTVRLFAADKSSATPEYIPLDILFEDEHIVAINKQVGLLVHPSRTEKSGTLTNGLAFHFWQITGEAIRPGLVHRLDRNTSGVILVAKTAKAHRTLSKHFRERWVKKFYLALVSGTIAQDKGEIDAPIGSDKNTWPHWQVMENGRPAQTIYRVKCRYHSHTLVELEPLTGRTHQLRIHCALIGHPILGDTIYSNVPDDAVKSFGIKHHILHASRLVFRHPATNNEMIIEAPMPDLMHELIAGLSS